MWELPFLTMRMGISSSFMPRRATVVYASVASRTPITKRLTAGLAGSYAVDAACLPIRLDTQKKKGLNLVGDSALIVFENRYDSECPLFSGFNNLLVAVFREFVLVDDFVVSFSLERVGHVVTIFEVLFDFVIIGDNKHG